VELEQSKARLTELKGQGPRQVAIPPELRAAFAGVGLRLPELWERLPIDARKDLLRTLVTGVNLNRDTSGVIQIRIAWRGGAVTDRSIGVPVFSFRDTERERIIVARIRAMVEAGENDVRIAERLNREGMSPCRGVAFTAVIVAKIRRRHHILMGLERLRRGERPPGYTVREMAGMIGIDPSWISRQITRGHILLKKDARYQCYLFPRTRSAVAQIRQLKNGKLRQVSFPKGAQ